MCGIVGFTSGKTDLNILKEMQTKIAHRGPDDEGVYQDEYVSMAHKRLSIIDIEGGHQPMFSADGRYVIVYNGELYNYRGLRKTLQAQGYQFSTHSDTEVLLYWLAKKGVKGLIDFNGMFAFAFWDRKEKTLILARDRLGIKPLYYYTDKESLVFGSEIKALLPLVSQREANLNAVYEFLTFQNILSSKTFFKDIYKLLPGHWLKWTPSGISNGCYWDISFPGNFNSSFNDAVEEYIKVLKDSVSRHMISDVPVGAYLSGGFDSPSVATLATNNSNETIHTFTGAFTDAPYYDERIGSRAVAKNIGAILHEVEITPQDYLENIGKVIYHLDEPTLGTGAFPQYMVSKLVSQSVKVVLTGHGGDEMFAGYQVYKVALIKETLRKNLAQIGSVLLGIKRDEWSRVLYYWLYPLLYPEVGYGLFIMVPKRWRTSFFTPDFLARNKDFEPFNSLADFVQGKDDMPGERLLRLYLKTYLPTLFIQEDKVGMAHSIEARTPLCDNEMVELSLKFPLRMKLWGNNLKAITKTAMKSRLPEVLYTLPKRGFPTPFARWYRREPLKSFMEDLLFNRRAEERGIFKMPALKRIFQQNLYSKTDTLFDYTRANILYSTSIVELWYRTYIDQKDPKPVR
jgi:asparagine synthase (glutamine-hydrolysing)